MSPQTQKKNQKLSKSQAKSQADSLGKIFLTALWTSFELLVAVGLFGVGLSYIITSTIYNRLLIFNVSWLLTAVSLLLWIAVFLPLQEARKKYSPYRQKTLLWLVLLIFVFGGYFLLWFLADITEKTIK